jgi:hypothetical protein
VSALSEHAGEYVRLRRALGAQLTETAPLLAEFTGYLADRGQPTVTVTATLAWAAGRPGVTRPAIARRIAAVRGFAAYLQVFEPATEVPPRHLLPAGPTRTPAPLLRRGDPRVDRRGAPAAAGAARRRAGSGDWADGRRRAAHR